ncbi:uncharacterized protein Bfra_009714 [Botrytis fragariae]|uniref:Uncharacterized protein n=1 Tax=Botrytis fragariae TaxID=1964551 RepID=A0A8H6EFT3_9HELO|nr:uncharacterized protein Bfra_009714 [Botrytis fragariae]KAF5870330.1 hypothetical protein Bfra_009714 [Botrytis fragariae]
MSTSFDLSLSLALGEPIICLNTSCNYPFGRICSECSNEFESRTRAQAQAQSKTNPDSNFNNRVNETHPALPRSITVQSRSHDISTRVADIVEDLQGIFAFVPAAPAPAPQLSEPAPAVLQKPSKLTIRNLQTFDATPSPLKLQPLPLPPPNSHSQSSSASTSQSSHSTPPPLSPLNASILNTWLNDIVLRTLEGQVLSPTITGGAFTGGAEEEDKLEAMCPYCDASMGEGAWRELHLINCRYAHVEAERLKIVRGKVLERGVSGK